MNIIKIPFSGGGLGKGQGSDKAPEHIIGQLKDMFANESGTEPHFTFHDIPVDEYDPESTHENIQTHLSSITQPWTILGGDHSITYSIVKAFSKQYKEFSLIIFDAHPDLIEPMDITTQEDYLRKLIDDHIVKPEDISLLAVRNWDVSEIDYIKEHDIQCFTAKDIFKKGIKTIISQLLTQLKKPIYLSIDIDAVDPIEAIGTGYLEHGGLSSRELIYAIQQIKASGLLKSSDIVEVNPQKDINDITAKLAAKLVMELSS